jgi:endonuclease/exonuclease/phosphatase family metal-dependent hydrolase
VWADLDDGDPPYADLSALTQDMPISCRENNYPEFFDHLVVDPRVRPWVDRTSFRHVASRQADKGDWDTLSDHYPVQVELWGR